MSPSRARSFRYVLFAYAAGLAAAFVAARAVGHAAPPLTLIAWADLAATLVVFLFSVMADNTSVYDPYWSVAPLVIAPALALAPAAAGAPLARKALVVALVFAWGLRLTWHWTRNFAGLEHEDWRYLEFRDKTGPLYWVMSLVGLHVFPTIQVFLGCLPLLPALQSARPLGPMDALAALVTLGAVAIEAVADEQLRAFRLAKRKGEAPGVATNGSVGAKPLDEIMQRGLWGWSRHPNYFGEVSFWWGLFLFGLAADPGAWWSGAGALAITLMFVGFSIPALDKRSAARRPAYAEHMKRVSAIVPLPPRR